MQYFVYNMTYTEVVANYRATEDTAIARQNHSKSSNGEDITPNYITIHFFFCIQ